MKCQRCRHIETSQLICFANQLISFSMREAQLFLGLTLYFDSYFRVGQMFRIQTLQIMR